MQPDTQPEPSAPTQPEATADLTTEALAPEPGAISLLVARYPQLPTAGILILGVMAITLATHWPALSARAVSFDDHQYLLDNPLVKTPSLKSVWRFFTEVFRPSSVAGYYQPLTMVSLMIDVALGGGRENFVPFHVTSLLLHALNTALLVVLLYLIFERPWPAAAAGLMFGVHPLMIEPIPWISERKTLLAGFFAFAGLVCYVAYCGGGNKEQGTGNREQGTENGERGTGNRSLRRFYGVSLVLYLLALLSKPTTVPLPVMMLLMDVWPLRRFNRRAVLEKVPFLILGALFAWVTVVSQSRASTISVPTLQTVARVPLVICHNIVFYLSKMVWPTHLSSHYPFPPSMTLSQPMILLGVLGTCVLLFGLAASLSRTRALLVGWLIFLAAALPTMQIIGFSDVIASDKYVYFPMVGILLIVAWGLTQVATRASAMTRKAVTAIVVIAIAAEVLATRTDLPVWKDTETHYTYMLSLTPKAASLHNNLALELAGMKRYGEAIDHYRRALELKPGDERAITNLGLAMARAGQRTEAIELYRRMLREMPNSYSVHCNLGALLAESGETEQATEHYRVARLLKPDSAEALTNYANGLMTLGRVEDAAKAYQEALEYRPDIADIHNNLAACLEELGRRDEARYHLRMAVTLNPDYYNAQRNLAVRLAEDGDLPAATHHAREALRLEPANAEAQFMLAQLLGHAGQISEAVKLLDTLLRDDPGHQLAADFRKNLRTQTTQSSIAKPLPQVP